MSNIDFRQGATQVQKAAFNAGMVKFVSFEILVIAASIGLAYKSWTWGLGLFFGLIAAFNVPGAKSVLAVTFSAGWAVIAYFVMRAVAPTEAVAPIIAAIVGFLLSIAAHSSFFQWQKDFR
jgi:hypothetical protein